MGLQEVLNAIIHLPELGGMFAFGQQDQVGMMGDDLLQVVQSPGQLVDPDHSFGSVEIHLPQGISD